MLKTAATFCLVLLVIAATRPLTAGDGLPASTNSLGMTLVEIPAGEYEFGSNVGYSRLMHAHSFDSWHRLFLGNNNFDSLFRGKLTVAFTQPPAFAATEVTVGQFRRFVEATDYVTVAEKNGGGLRFNGNTDDDSERFVRDPEISWRNPGWEQTDDHPVTCVTWHDAVAFCKWLSEKEGRTYRLPSEVEWEYACRAGTKTIYAHGNDPFESVKYGNMADGSMYQEYPDLVVRQRVVQLSEEEGDGYVYTAPVGSFQPNPWGLYDMHGNLWEWTQDKWDPQAHETYAGGERKTTTVTDPKPILADTPAHKFGDWRTIKGGSWYVTTMHCRSSNRAFVEASDAYPYTGFRVVREVD